eukprot:symbB.v1.2.035317.t1/scaffold4726.1/size35721/2
MGRPQEYPELMVAAYDLASILEERLSEAEHRLSEVLQNVEFLEEFRELFRSHRNAKDGGGGHFGTRWNMQPQAPAVPRPPSARPCRQEVQNDALEARLSKIEADLQQSLKVQQFEDYFAEERASMDAQFADFQRSLRSYEDQMQRFTLDPSFTKKCGAMLEVVGQVPPRPTSRDPEVPQQRSLEQRQDALEVQFGEFGRTLLGLLSDVQVLSAQSEWRLGALEKAQRVRDPYSSPNPMMYR